jgi:hypothetical protein
LRFDNLSSFQVSDKKLSPFWKAREWYNEVGGFFKVFGFKQRLRAV